MTVVSDCQSLYAFLGIAGLQRAIMVIPDGTPESASEENPRESLAPFVGTNIAGFLAASMADYYDTGIYGRKERKR